MLIEIRDKASSWVAYIIIGLLILSFSMWGIQEYFGPGATDPAAKVNDNEISLAEFSNQFRQRRDILKSTLGANYDQQYTDESIIKQEVIKGMVRNEVLRQEVHKAGYRISDASLIKRIEEVPQFQTDGKFNAELYDRFTQAQRYGKAELEAQLREEDKLRQFEGSVATSSFMPKADLQHFQKLADQTREFNYAILKADLANTTVSDEDIQKHYDEYQARYQTPEQVKLAYIELKEADIADQIEVNDEDARIIYDSQPERFMTNELRKVSHILLKVSTEVASDGAEWTEALEKANGFIKQLEDGTSFEELVKQHSEDTLSAEKGGDIGFIAPGDFSSTELEDALFNLKVGAYSQPIKTDQGIQIIQLTEIEAAEQEAFADVKERIMNEQKSQLAQTRYIEVAEQISNLMAEQPDDLDEASETHELEIKQTAWLASNSNTELFAYPKIQALAFSEDVLVEKLNSELTEVAPGHAIAFRVLEHKQSSVKPLAEVKTEITYSLKFTTASEQTATLGKELVSKLQAGTSLQQISEDHTLEFLSPGALKRNDTTVASSIVQRVFNLAKAEENKISADGVGMPDGNYALIELVKIVESADEINAEKTAELLQRVNYGRREFNAIMEDIEEGAEVVIFEDQL